MMGDPKVTPVSPFAKTDIARIISLANPHLVAELQETLGKADPSFSTSARRERPFRNAR